MGVEEDFYAIQRGGHIRPLAYAFAAVLDKLPRIRRVQLILGGAGESDVDRDAPGALAGIERDVEFVGVILDCISRARSHLEHVVYLVAADPVLVMYEAVRS